MTMTKQKTVVSFGAALAAVAVAPSADAAVVGLQFSGPNTFGSVTNTTVGLSTDGGADVIGRLNIYNDFSSAFGTTVSGAYSTQAFQIRNLTGEDGFVLGNLDQGNVLTPLVANTFSRFGQHIYGTQYFGFETPDNLLGWFSYDFGGMGNTTSSFVAGAINTVAGAAITIGQQPGQNPVPGPAPDPVSTVPIPAALPLLGTGLLAMGAVGIRRRRKERLAA